MKKNSIILIFLIVITSLQLAAQSHEIFFRLTKLTNYSVYSKSDTRIQNFVYLPDINYLLGYTHYFKNDIYTSVGFQYFGINKKYISNENLPATNRNITYNHDMFRYKEIDIAIGKRNTIHKFLLFSHANVNFGIKTNYKTYANSITYDAQNNSTGNYESNDQYPNEKYYSAYIGQGVYYPVFKNISMGLDINMIFTYLYQKGISTNTVIDNRPIIQNRPVTTIQKADIINKYYTFNLLPNFGVKYLFGKNKK